jgi:hypothetical protein
MSKRRQSGAGHHEPVGVIGASRSKLFLFCADVMGVQSRDGAVGASMETPISVQDQGFHLQMPERIQSPARRPRISLCDRAREVCSECPVAPELAFGASPTPRANPEATSNPAHVRAHRRRAGHPHRLPHRGDQSCQAGGDLTCLTSSSTSATWSTASRAPSPSTPPTLASRCLARRLSPTSCEGNLRLEPRPLHRRRHRGRG